MRHRRASLRIAGARSHERAPTHPDEIAHAGAREGEQHRPRRERARGCVQARQVAQRAKPPEGPLGPAERPHDDRHVAGPEVAHQVLGLAEHEAACEELRHHRGVRRLARKRHAERGRGIGRVLVVERVRVDVEVELPRLAPREHEPRQHDAHVREQRLRRAGRRGLRDAHERRPGHAAQGGRGRCGGDQRCRGEHAGRATQHRSPWHLRPVYPGQAAPEHGENNVK